MPKLITPLHLFDQLLIPLQSKNFLVFDCAFRHAFLYHEDMTIIQYYLHHVSFFDTNMELKTQFFISLPLLE